MRRSAGDCAYWPTGPLAELGPLVLVGVSGHSYLTELTLVKKEKGFWEQPALAIDSLVQALEKLIRIPRLPSRPVRAPEGVPSQIPSGVFNLASFYLQYDL